MLAGGKTVLCDLYDCNPLLLQNVESHYKMLVELPMEIGMRPISAPQIARWDIPQANKHEEWGYSGTILFAESHAYYHTWPEFSFMLFDLTSCKDFPTEVVIEGLKRFFGAKEIVVETVFRGRRKV